MAVTIPSGKKVIIKEGKRKLAEGVNLLLEEDITLSLQSDFAPLIESGGNTMVTALGQLSRDLTGFGFSNQFKQMGFQIWKNTSPVAMSLTVGLYMNRNAYTDVVQPAKELMRLPLPDVGADGSSLVPPGPSILEALTEKNATGKSINVRIGNIVHLKKVIVTKVEPTMSNEVDEYGHPIWMKLAIDINTIFTATTVMIDNSVGTNPPTSFGNRFGVE